MKRLEIRLPDKGPLARAWSMPLGHGQPSIAITPDGTRLVYVLEHQGVTQLYLRGIDQLQATPIPQRRARSALSSHLTANGSVSSPETNSRKWRCRAANRSISARPPIPMVDPGGRTERSCLPPTKAADPRLFGRAGEFLSPSWSRTVEVLSDSRISYPAGKRRSFQIPCGVASASCSFETGEFRLLVERAGGGRYAPSGHLVFARAGSIAGSAFRS